MAKCKGINRKGKKCGSSAIEGSDYCQDHQKKALQSEDKRPSKQRKALWGSIQKWHNIVFYGAEDNGCDNCPLCILHFLRRSLW